MTVEPPAGLDEDLLARLERRDTLEKIMEHTRAHLAYLDPDFNFVRVNSAYAAGCGYAKGELIGRNHFELFPHAENQAIFEEVRRTGGSVEFLARPFAFPDRPERLTYWDWTLTADTRGDGSVAGLILSLFDVTREVEAAGLQERLLAEVEREQRRAEALAGQARQRADELAAVVSSLADPVLVVDGSGMVAGSNPAARSLLGFDPVGLLPQELGGRLANDLNGTSELAAELHVVRRALTGEVIRDERFPLRDAAGQVRIGLASAAPVRDGARITAAVVAWHDVTERERLLEELRINLDELGRANATLRQAREEGRQREVEISALLAATRVVLEHRPFAEAAGAIFSACKCLIGAPAGYLSLTTADGRENEAVFLDPGGEPCTVDPALPMPIRGLRAVAYAGGRAVVENDFPASAWVGLLPEGHAPVGCVLFAPLVVAGRTVGLLGLANKPGGFDANDARLATAFAEIAAIALCHGRAREGLEASLREKEVLLQEVHHRVKNNLQVVASMLNLQAGTVDDPRVRAPLEESQNRIRTLALIHEKLYRSSDLASIPFREYLDELVGYLVRQGGESAVAVRSEVADVRLGISTAIPVALIVNELVSNCMKHAFIDREKGTITIRLQPGAAGGLVLEVEDDGVGFPEVVDPRATESLGLQLVTVLAVQLGGEVVLERGAGARFVIAFDPAAQAGRSR